MTKHQCTGFTLIELLVVVSIIAILAAILFPVYSQVREKSRRVVCVSNAKQIAMAYLQYAEDYDESVPIAFAQKDSFGPLTAKYNVAGIGGAAFQPTGIQTQLQPYIKTYDVFVCPDDPTLSAAQLTLIKKNPGIATSAELAGMNFAQIWGTSYQFTHEVESNPNLLTTNTGYATSGACPGGMSELNSDKYVPPALQGAECDLVASGEPIDQTGYWSPSPADVGHTGFGTVTLSVFSRPTETRILHEWNTAFPGVPDTPKQPMFHNGGGTVAYEDGHARFIGSLTDFQSGCDGVDWAWDVAGSCNDLGLQRNAD
jgi:prepilin-type N-terminal cleavage/methylation domain-containing protein